MKKNIPTTALEIKLAAEKLVLQQANNKLMMHLQALQATLQIEQQNTQATQVNYVSLN
ncbi:MAG TPA: hypothetical protein VKG26_14300 [Bacteroidia bacterium]|nr:hypothetical protein [Bacteroidia bacterium]